MLRSNRKLNIIGLIIIIFFMAVNIFLPKVVQADEIKAKIIVGNVSGKTGQIIKVPIKVENAEELYGIQFKVKYDKNIVKLKSKKNENNYFLMAFASSEAVISNNNVYFIEFEIIGNENKKLDIKLKDVKLNKKDGTKIEAEIKNGSITVDNTVDDLEKPIITTDLQNKTVKQPEFTFIASSINSKGEKIIPIVKLNEKVVKDTYEIYEVELKEGENIITIEAEDEKGVRESRIFKITYKKEIIQKVESVQINKNHVVLGIEKSEQLKVKVLPENAVNKKVKWRASDSNIVVVSENGIVKGLKEGQATIIVTAEDGNESAQCIVTVLENEAYELYLKINESVEKTADYMINGSTYSNDWKVAGLVNAGKSVPGNYLSETAKTVDNYLKNTMKTKLEKVTDYERTTIGVAAAGGEPRNIGGHDLIKRIYNFEGWKNPNTGEVREIDFQGLNGVIYGLIALDTKRFEIPKDAKNTRESLLQYVMEVQNTDGGWDLGTNGSKSDVDITAMTLISLAPYQNKQTLYDRYDKDFSYVTGQRTIKEAIEEAVKWLSNVQRKDNGGFSSWFTSDNSESVAQTIIGLCANGIDPTCDEFTKNGHNLIDALLSFEVGDGTFLHVKEVQPGMPEPNIGISTEQAFQALTAYKKFIEMGREYDDGKTSIYYFGDATEIDNIKPEISTDLENKTVNEKEIIFSTKIIDNKDIKLNPIIKVNGKKIKEYKNGYYKAALIEGQNTITIEAQDKTGNKADKKTFIIIYKPCFEISRVGNETFKKGEDVELKVKVTNTIDNNKDVVLIVAIYDKINKKMINYSYVSKTVKAGETEILAGGFPTSENGEYIVKAMVWDGIDNAKALTDFIEVTLD